MTRPESPPKHGGTGRWWIFVLGCLCAALLGACRRDGDAARDTPTATPTLFVATASPAGIAGPPQTARPDAGDPERMRAESFLRRVVLTEADLPPSLMAKTAAFLDGSQLAARTPQEAFNRAQWDAAGLVLSLEAGFETPAGRVEGTDGTISRVTNTVAAFRQPAGAQSIVDASSGQQSLEGLVGSRATDVTTLQVDEPRLGESSSVWRASGVSNSNPGIQIVAWGFVIRRGAATVTLVIDGAGTAVDRSARDLAQRLDQRLAAALASGAWP